MLRFFKFRQELFEPQPARDVYIKRQPGSGWPEQCPPVRAALSFGFDLLANFRLVLVQRRGKWSVQKDIVLESDFEWSAAEDGPAAPLTQQYAWFWKKGQKIPHVISDNVYKEISNQVKVSSFLYMKTDANELLYMTDIPNRPRPWRVVSAVVDMDWYPASYPWHIALELDPKARRIVIPAGEPLARVFTVRRDTYFAQAMSPEEFDGFFQRGQEWLAAHGRPQTHEQQKSSGDKEMLDIRGQYVRQQARSKFVVLP